MIKRLVFDLDNTLIMWKEEYKNAIKKTIEAYELNIDYNEVDNVIEEYENFYHQYTKENMIQLINKTFNLNLKTDFIDYWLKELGNMAEVDDYLIELLDYLSQKYELVVLTNWFKSSQVERLKTAKIYKYFKEIYGGDNVMKPEKQAYLNALSDKKIEECIMIGDSYETDIKGALTIGLKAIWITNQKSDECTTLKNIYELKEIL